MLALAPRGPLTRRPRAHAPRHVHGAPLRFRASGPRLGDVPPQGQEAPGGAEHLYPVFVTATVVGRAHIGGSAWERGSVGTIETLHGLYFATGSRYLSGTTDGIPTQFAMQ